jgi:3-oxo-5-alpha-steroid 4-dehydrogenase 3
MWCHTQLAGLKKYTLPCEGLFRYIVCPHYTCECLIYLSLAVLGAPAGQLHNQTIACALLLVAVNLGVTAAGTKRWYIERFGKDTVMTRWTMIPGIF